MKILDSLKNSVYVKERLMDVSLKKVKRGFLLCVVGVWKPQLGTWHTVSTKYVITVKSSPLPD